jgi:hypothetical protein
MLHVIAGQKIDTKQCCVACGRKGAKVFVVGDIVSRGVFGVGCCLTFASRTNNDE